MWKYILLALTGYFIYRFVVGFLLPVVRTTQLAKKQFEQMQSQMQERMQQSEGLKQENTAQAARKSTGSQNGPGDYIPFEEIK